MRQAAVTASHSKWRVRVDRERGCVRTQDADSRDNGDERSVLPISVPAPGYLDSYDAAVAACRRMIDVLPSVARASSWHPVVHGGGPYRSLAHVGDRWPIPYLDDVALDFPEMTLHARHVGGARPRR